MKIRNIVLVFVMLAISYGAGYFTSYRGEEVEKNNLSTVETVVIEEKDKRTVIKRKIKDKSLSVTNPPRRKRFGLSIDPTEPRNVQIGAGYRVMENLWLEGYSRPSNGEVFLGVSVEF